jgi:uncharacterized membrane protein YdjX (TVP38/TMEM64 family)
MGNFFDRHKKLIFRLIVILAIAVMAAITVKVSPRMLSLVKDPEMFRAWVDSKGAKNKIIFVLLIALQVFVSFIPGEPFELMAGYAFGAVKGTVICILGLALGTALIFIFTATLGEKIINFFFTEEEIKKADSIINGEKSIAIYALIMLVPGTPKDLLTYLAPFVVPKWQKRMLMVLICRLPSVVTSTFGGGRIGNQDYKVAATIFIVTAVISIIAMIVYNKLSNKSDKNRRS